MSSCCLVMEPSFTHSTNTRLFSQVPQAKYWEQSVMHDPVPPLKDCVWLGRDESVMEGPWAALSVIPVQQINQGSGLELIGIVFSVSPAPRPHSHEEGCYLGFRQQDSLEVTVVCSARRRRAARSVQAARARGA